MAGRNPEARVAESPQNKPNKEINVKLAILISSLGVSLFAQQAVTPPAKPADTAPYGFKAGTVGFTVGGGGMHISGAAGLHPAIKSSVEVGVHKYLGVFGEGGWSRASDSASACYYYSCASVSAHVNYYQLAGGLEVIGTNRSRVVPYGKVGMAYVGGAAHVSISGIVGGSASAYADAPAAMVAGGVRIYATHHVGADIQVTGLRTLGANGGSNIVAPTVGVFFQR